MKNLFDDITPANDYNAARVLPAETQRMWPNLLKTLIAPFAPNRILDLGAGTGRFTPQLRDCFGVPVVGIEPSDNMRQVAEREAPGEWLKGSAESIPLEDASVDLVWMSQVLHHVQDKERGAGEIGRILASEGFLAVRNGTIENNNAIPWLKCFPEALAFDETRLFTQEQLLRLFTKNGFCCKWWATINQFADATRSEYYSRVAKRGLSAMIGISDQAFMQGLERMKHWTEEQDATEPVFEPVDFFLFKKTVKSASP